jgi:F0F1-type ATP synthase epsilon subunit
MNPCFEMTVAARDKILFRGQAQICTIVGATGSRSFEARHETFLTILGSPSVIEFRTKTGQVKQIRVASGLVSFDQNSCQIVVEVGTAADDDPN